MGAKAKAKIGRLGALATVAVVVAILALPASAPAALPQLLTRFPESAVRGPEAGQFSVAKALATNQANGHLFVGESANRRVSEFTAWGEFVKAFGWDVAPGAVNEVQEVQVRATAGQFRLSFEGSQTSDLPFEAGGAEVQSALNALPTIGGAGGSVAVKAELGNLIPGQTPTVYVISFTGGSLTGADVPQLTASDGTAPLSGGKPTGVEVWTRADGTPGGTGLEACTAESGCQQGVRGSGPGQVNTANGLAVDGEGDIYVMDLAGPASEAGGVRVQKFDPSGRFLLMFGGEVDKTTGADVCGAADLDGGDVCGAGLEGTAPGWFLAPRFPKEGSIPQYFVPDYITAGPDGTVYVGDTERIQEFEADGVYKGEVTFASLHAANSQFPEDGAVGALDYDPASGDLYFARFLSPFPSAELNGQKVPLPFYRVSTETKQPVAVLLTETWNNAGQIGIDALAADHQGNVFVVVTGGRETRETGLMEFGPKGETLIGIDDEFATNRVVPRERLEQEALATNGAGDIYIAQNTLSNNGNPPTSEVVAYGPGPVAYGAPPKVPPRIADQFAAAVDTTGAVLKARINPHFWPDTRYYVEYGTSPCFEGGCQVRPSPPGSELTAEFVDAPVTSAGVLLEGLEPETTYHYRFVAQSTGGGPVEGLSGESGEAAEATFTTAAAPAAQAPCPANEALRGGAGARLPDCRAYEMVSPVDKNGADVAVAFNSLGDSTGLDRAAADGEALTYSTYRSFGDAESAPYVSQYLASRQAGGSWSSRGISPPREGSSVYSNPTLILDSQYKAFSADLCHGWLLQDSDVGLAAGRVAGWANIYRRDLCAGGYEHLAPTGAPSVQVNPTGRLEDTDFRPEVQGASADGTRTFFVAKGRLAPELATARLECQTSSEATISYRWLRDGVPVSGATSANYTIGAADEGTAIQCQVSATNASGGTTAVANPAAAVAPLALTEMPAAPEVIPAPAASAPLTVGGAGGQQLSCDPRAGEWSGEPSFAYRWYRNGAEIAAATGSTYAVSEADLASPASFQCEALGSSGGVTVSQASAPLASDPAPSEPAAPQANAAMPTASQLYEAGPEGLRLVCIQPNGRPLRGGCSAGMGGFGGGLTAHPDRGASLGNAVSEDGSVVYWTGAAEGPGRLYVSTGGGATTTQVGGLAAQFLAAAADGSAAIFAEGETLYRYELGDAREALAGGFEGLVGASEDASRLYFVSTEDLAAGGSEGELNLYLYEAGEGGGFTFVATLVEENKPHKSTALAPIGHTARVSADGGTVAFMSQAQLTGYANKDAASGEPVAEVYLYAAASDRLICPSCPASGARAHGGRVSDEYVAAWLPPAANQLTFPRVLSDDGSRLFFESFDPLALRDTNGRRDVYEWEALGAGTCTEAAPGYNPFYAGCVDLISSGESPQDSEIVDASADGRDVFFKTAQSLDARDEGLIDIYDARSGGGTPPPEPPAANCEGDACQGPATAPEDPTPSSQSFRGAGNLSETASRASRCTAPARRARSLSARAKKLRRSSRRLARAGKAAGARRANRKAARLASSARRQAKSAKRCRRRARAARRAQR